MIRLVGDNTKKGVTLTNGNQATISTPAYNKIGDVENPDNKEGKEAINDMISIRSINDPVQGGMAGEDTYRASSDHVRQYIAPTKLTGTEAHSFDVNDPKALEQAVKGDGGISSQGIDKLKPVEKQK